MINSKLILLFRNVYECVCMNNYLEDRTYRHRDSRLLWTTIPHL